MKKWLGFILAAALVLSFAACGSNVPAEREDPEIPEISENPEQEIPPETEGRKEVSSVNYENAVKIVLSGNGAAVDGKSAEESTCVKIGGEIVYYHDMDNYESGNPYGEGEDKDKHTEKEAAEHTLVTITEPGEYFVTGELKGQLAVDLGEEAKENPEAKVTLIFGGADITCEIAPAVIFYNVYECADSEKEASSEADTSAAGANVIVADGSLSSINGANVAKIFKDEAGEKKLHKYDGAFYSKMSMNIEGGENDSGVLRINAKNEGIGSEMHLTVNGGIIEITSEDDGINTNEDGISVTTINGGKITVKGGNGSEGDGIDSNGWLIINGGTLYASGNGRTGDGGIDADMGISINGGNVCAFGSRNDYVDFESEQLFARLDFASTREAGSLLEFKDGEETVISVTGDREFQSVIISGDMLEENKNYSLYLNGVLQEYSSDISNWKQVYDGFEVSFPGGIPQIPEGEHQIPEGTRKNPYEIPEGFEEWLAGEKDMPAEIKAWIEAMAEMSEQMYVREDSGNMTHQNRQEITNDAPGENKGNVPGEPLSPAGTDSEGMTVFILKKGSLCFYGIYDSPSAAGKEKVSFTINGEDRIDDIFIGDIPEINSIECTEKVPEKHVQITLAYRGSDESINVSKSCLLSEGIEAIRKLFEGLEPGAYRLTIGVLEENEDYSGSEVFNFEVVD